MSFKIFLILQLKFIFKNTQLFPWQHFSLGQKAVIAMTPNLQHPLETPQEDNSHIPFTVVK